MQAQFSPRLSHSAEVITSDMSKIKYINWISPEHTCRGYWRHNICVFGIEDLQHLIHLHWSVDSAKQRFHLKLDVTTHIMGVWVLQPMNDYPDLTSFPTSRFAVNKFDISKSRVAFECFEEWHRNRTRHSASFPIDFTNYPLALLTWLLLAYFYNIGPIITGHNAA